MKPTLGNYLGSKTPFKFDIMRLIQGKLLVMANSGGGKSWMLRKLIEAAYGHVQIIVLDVEGEFANLRKDFDFVLAGKEGDIPADAQYAEVLATRMLELETNLIADLYELKPPQRILFIRRFLEGMVNAPKRLWHPVLVILDEAHKAAPEKGNAESLNAVIDLASLGRKRGYCLALATQRLAKLHKDAATECQNKLIGLANWDLDRKRAAEELGLVDREAVMSLRDLTPGEFYAVGSAFDRGVNRIIVGPTVSKHLTFGGQQGKQHTPAPSAKVKSVLSKLVDLPKEAVQEAQDKASLQAKVNTLTLTIRQLERQLKSAPQTAPAPDKGALQTAEARGHARGAHEASAAIKKALTVVKPLDQLVKGDLQVIKARAEDAETKLNKIVGVLNEYFGGIVVNEYTPLPKAKPLMPIKEGPVFKGGVNPPSHSPRPAPPSAMTPRNYPSQGIQENGGEARQPLKAGEKKILAFLAARGEPMTQVQIGAISGFSSSSGTFSTYLSRLRGEGLVVKVGDRLSIQLGAEDRVREILGNDFIAPGIDSFNAWLTKLKAGERKIFDCLRDSPQPLSKEDICQSTGFTNSGTFSTYISRLTTMGLIIKTDGGFQFNPELQEFQ